jgi:hypothetical protein
MGHRLVCLALSLVVLGCGKSGPDKVVSDLEDLRASMCACKDQKDSTGCMRDVLEGFRAWKAANGPIAGTTLTDDQRNRVSSAHSELLSCCIKADASGGNECMDTIMH